MNTNNILWPKICNTGRDLAIRDNSIWDQKEPAVRDRSFQFVPSVGIQNSKTFCLNPSLSWLLAHL
jgi:hypothetical protein